jgi:hypothetical protein
MKRTLVRCCATVVLALGGLALPAGAAFADDVPTMTKHGDTAPHSEGPVVSVINGDVTVIDGSCFAPMVSVPVGGSKVGPGQGCNEFAAPQEDGANLPVNPEPESDEELPFPVL